MSDNSVVFKGSKDGIVILLDHTADFSTIKTILNKKIIDAKKFFGNSTTCVSFKGRELAELEEIELIEIISKHSDLKISFVNSHDFKQGNIDDESNIEELVFNPLEISNLNNSALEHKTESTLKLDTIDELFISADQNDTIFHKGSLRSGQAIHHAGSVVIIGDVNPGSEVVAEGNIIVLGNVKGVVHAGCGGNFDCFVAALNLSPVQLRISEVISYMPKDEHDKKSLKSAAFAYIKDSQIYIRKLN